MSHNNKRKPSAITPTRMKQEQRDEEYSPSSHDRSHTIIHHQPPPHRQMPSILLPVRDPRSVHPSSSNNANGQQQQRVRWVGMTPLEWIDSLVLQASVDDSRRDNSNGVATRSSTATVACARRSRNVDDVSMVDLSPQPISGSTHPDTISSSSSLLLPPSTSGYHHHQVTNINQVPKYFWDVVSFFDSITHNGMGSQGGGPNTSLWLSSLSTQIRRLALLVESQPNFHTDLELSYKRVHDHCLSFIDHFRRTYLQPKQRQHAYAVGQNVPSKKLQQLGEEVIHKLQALLDLSQKLQVQQQQQGRYYDNSHRRQPPATATLPPPPAVLSKTSSMLTNSPTSSTASSSASSLINTAKSMKKQDLSKYMTDWLRDNWTNPYPDDFALHQMSKECNSSTTVVSNWLINARTRKWRPAIVKAYDMNRPADLLLEDSINIFCGKPLRPLLDDGSCNTNVVNGNGTMIKSGDDKGTGHDNTQLVVSSSSASATSSEEEEEESSNTSNKARKKSPNKRARYV